jgi:probable HAF family extracellular repeat protein
VAALGINNSGEIVGVFRDLSSNLNYQGFLLDQNGTFTTINVPGATFTQANGINDEGQIVGQFGGQDGKTYAFLAIPSSCMTNLPPWVTFSTCGLATRPN